jgi:hypothetical protein
MQRYILYTPLKELPKDGQDEPTPPVASTSTVAVAGAGADGGLLVVKVVEGSMKPSEDNDSGRGNGYQTIARPKNKKKDKKPRTVMSLLRSLRKHLLGGAKKKPTKNEASGKGKDKDKGTERDTELRDHQPDDEGPETKEEQVLERSHGSHSSHSSLSEQSVAAPVKPPLLQQGKGGGTPTSPGGADTDTDACSPSSSFSSAKPKPTTAAEKTRNTATASTATATATPASAASGDTTLHISSIKDASFSFTSARFRQMFSDHITRVPTVDHSLDVDPQSH